MEETLTRRRLIGATAAATAAAGIAAIAGCKKEETPVTPEPTTPEPVKFKVYNPSGAMQITHMFAPRLDSLEGKVIAFVADDSWEDARMFPIIKKYLEEKYHCTVFEKDNWPSGVDNLTKDNNGIPELLHEKGVEGVIVGNAG